MIGCVRICNVLHGLKPVLAMVVIQTLNAGINVTLKLVANDGMSLTVFTAYRVIFASALMIPLALLVERNRRPKMTWAVLGQAFLCGLVGIAVAQNLYIKSTALISATFTVAIGNLVPVITFIMAVCFRQEKLAIRSISGMAKVVGTAVGVGGAALFIFYKGIPINLWSIHTHLLHNNGHHQAATPAPSAHPHHSNNEALGSALALLACLGSSSWLIIQGKMTKTYPCPLSSTALITLMATIQAVVFALSVERDWSQWKLGWNIRLFGVVYGGLAYGIAVAASTWCVNIRGPLFVASFAPVLLVVVAIFGSLLLEEKFYLGSILGALLIICGLYLVVWGKSIEMKKMNRVEPLETPRPSEVQSIEIMTTSPPGATENSTTRGSRRVTMCSWCTWI